MTSGEVTRPTGTAREGGRIEVDPKTTCGAPDCALALDEHRDDNGEQARGYTIDGVLVGSRRCGEAYLLWRETCQVCGQTGSHTCDRAANAYLRRLRVQIRLPRRSGEAVPR